MSQKEFERVKNYVLKEIPYYGGSVPYDYILLWIEAHCQNKQWSNTKESLKGHLCMTTYGLKHIIESDFVTSNGSRGYCANNWVKCALFELGYDIRIDQTNSKPTADDMLNNSVNLNWRKI